MRLIVMLCYCLISIEAVAMTPTERMELARLDKEIEAKKLKIVNLEKKIRNVKYEVDYLERKRSRRIITASVGYSVAAIYGISIPQAISLTQNSQVIQIGAASGTTTSSEGSGVGMKIIAPVLGGILLGVLQSSGLNSELALQQEYKQSLRQLEYLKISE